VRRALNVSAQPALPHPSSRPGTRPGGGSERRLAVNRLVAWLDGAGIAATIEAVTGRVASRFKQDALVAKGLNRRTANKQIHGCSAYWRWMVAQDHAEDNPWRGKGLAEGHEMAAVRERPFTDDEVRRLLTGGADQELADVMRIAALAGMRIEEIYHLRVQDCAAGVFAVGRAKAKTRAAERMVPIHSALAGIVRRRCKGKAPGDYLIEGPDATVWDGSRSFAAGKRFGKYRQRCGVHDKPDGRRRSRVNFHSWRRWFATKAERAEHHEHLVSRVLGHRLAGMSFGVYSGGALVEQLRAVVESVKLPRARTGATATDGLKSGRAVQR
jgi:integrase